MKGRKIQAETHIRIKLRKRLSRRSLYIASCWLECVNNDKIKILKDMNIPGFSFKGISFPAYNKGFSIKPRTSIRKPIIFLVENCTIVE